MKEGGLDHVLFGRNEQGNQHFHQWIDKILDSDTDEDINRLFEEPHNKIWSQENIIINNLGIEYIEIQLISNLWLF